MDKPNFFWDLLNSINPFYYHNVADRKLWLGFKHVFLVLLLCFGIMLVILIPFFASLPNTVYNELKKFDTLAVNGTASMSEPIEIPKRNTVLAIDTTGKLTLLEKEKVLVTKEYIYFKFFTKTKRISIDKLMNIGGYKKEFVWMLISFLALIIPSLLFYTYLIFLIKYLLVILVLALIVFVTERLLLLYKVSFKRVFNVLMFAIAPMALIEICFIPINTDYLIPLFTVYYVNFYLVSTLVYLVLSVFSIVIVERKIKLFEKDE